MKKILIFLLLLFPFMSVFATGELNEEIIPEPIIKPELQILFEMDTEIQKHIPLFIHLGEEYNIDISHIYEKLTADNPDFEFEILWDMPGTTSQEGPIYQKIFETKGEKDLTLTITHILPDAGAEEQDETGEDDTSGEDENDIIYQVTFPLLVYETSYLFIYSDSIENTKLANYFDFSRKIGVYLYPIGPISKHSLETSNIINNINDFQMIAGEKGDYNIIWGNSDFIFDVFSKINSELSHTSTLETYTFVGISSYNLDILGNYLKNFLTNKPWLQKILLLGEDAGYILLNQTQIDTLEKVLQENKQTYLDVNLSGDPIGNIFFLSKFINHLSNMGHSTNSIYIFLIIPIVLTGIIIFKHILGFTPIGLVVPLFTVLLFFKLGVWISLALIAIFLLLNIGLSFIIDRYNLLYSPKIVFLLSINIIFFIGIFNILTYYQIASLGVSDILYFIIFILLSDKFINILTSKDINEYYDGFTYTIIFAVIFWALLSISGVKVFLLSYPEIILILIPLNFIIGRFTGLRMSEYFRFKEVIKSIEE